MWESLVPILLLATAATSQHYNQIYSPSSAASASQIKFALESKYDDTGPGAKGREFAYNTYKTLDEALIGYIDDPDTKLPEHERNKALNLISNLYGQQKSFDTRPQNWKPYGGFVVPGNKLFRPSKKPSVVFNYDSIPVRNSPAESHLHSFKHQRVQSIKGSPLIVGHYTKSKLAPEEEPYHQFDSVPNYSSNQEAYEANSHGADERYPNAPQQSAAVGSVGHYTFVDAHGKAQTVHYFDDTRRSSQPSS